jgi:hypothetical protein
VDSNSTDNNNKKRTFECSVCKTKIFAKNEKELFMNGWNVIFIGDSSFFVCNNCDEKEKSN